MSEYVAEHSEEYGILERDAHDIAHMQEHVRVYIGVFMALAVLTCLTVGIAYIHFPGPIAISIGLLIAVIKGSLVAAYFMHLIDERKAIYYVLILTGFFFIVMMGLPLGHHEDSGPNVSGSTVEAKPAVAGTELEHH